MNQQLDTYTPSESEEYMNPQQLAYFERKLRNWKREIVSASVSMKKELQETWLRGPDMFDVASVNTEIALDLGDMERQRSKLSLIERALMRIKNGEYGYCEVTGEKIGLKRLEAQPTAILCIEAQEQLERAERGMRMAQVPTMATFP